MILRRLGSKAGVLAVAGLLTVGAFVFPASAAVWTNYYYHPDNANENTWFSTGGLYPYNNRTWVSIPQGAGYGVNREVYVYSNGVTQSIDTDINIGYLALNSDMRCRWEGWDGSQGNGPFGLLCRYENAAK